MSFGYAYLDNGGTYFSSTDLNLRVVARKYVPYNFSGDILVPEYDSGRGPYFLKGHLSPFAHNGSWSFSLVKMYDSYADVNATFPNRSGSHPQLAGYKLLTATTHSGLIHTWNNGTKKLSISGSYYKLSLGSDKSAGNIEFVFMERG